MVKDGTLIGTRKLMIQLITQIAAGDNAASSKREDSLLRLWCVLNLVDFWNDELASIRVLGLIRNSLMLQLKCERSFRRQLIMTGL